MEDLLSTTRVKVKQVGQEHTLDAWDTLNPDQQASLLADLQAVDFEYLKKVCDSSLAASSSSSEEATSVDAVSTRSNLTAEQRDTWRTLGLQQIAQGKLGIVLMAGGQGTRLGSSAPKGCYNIGLPSNKTLFQLQAERLVRLQCMAAEAAGKQKDAVIVPWYIMTSEFTDEETQSFFKEHNFFGLDPNQVRFFQQGTMPCVTEEGRLIMETPYKVAKSPDGNGGIYAALKRSGCLQDMLDRGVEGVDCYCVDNALARLGDPLFVGFCCDQKADCAARVVAKAYPTEKVGVFARAGPGGAVRVVEYSELPPDKAASTGEDGTLLFNWGNIAMHYFSTAFLTKVAEEVERGGVYHVARKNIPSVAGAVPGIKLELFIFDYFHLAASVPLLEVIREEEFAPVKNAPGSAADSPDTARALLSTLHQSWIRAAGGSFVEDEKAQSVEVSGILSYAGENLELKCNGQSFMSPIVIE